MRRFTAFSGAGGAAPSPAGERLTMVAQIRLRRTPLARLSLSFGLVGVPVLVLAALGHRLGMFDTPTMFAVMAIGVGFAALAVVTALIALTTIWRRGDEGTGAAVRGLVLGMAVLAFPLYSACWVVVLPQLSDIATDPTDPVDFGVARISRPPGANQIADPSPAAIAAQQRAYPQIAARRYPQPTDVVFDTALRLVDARRWQVVDLLEPVTETGSGRIEMVVRTLLFAFRDDVVIVVAPDGEGTRVDMRSASQYGRHDLGTNAARIAGFLTDLDQALAESASLASQTSE